MSHYGGPNANPGRGFGGAPFGDPRRAAGRGPSNPNHHPFPRGGGAGRGHGGRGRGGRGPGGRGGRGRGQARPQQEPDLSQQNRSLTNVVTAFVAQNFSFYMYTLNFQDKNGQPVDSRGRRRDLFRKALLENHLRDLDRATTRAIERGILFQGSFLFSVKRIPGLKSKDLPKTLKDFPGADGARLEMKQVFHFEAPTALTKAPSEMTATAATQTQRDGQVGVLKRCANCDKVFDEMNSLLQHCSNSGHMPVYDGGEHDDAGVPKTPAEPEVFIAFVNQLLERALLDAPDFKKWGRSFIDQASPPKEPTDKTGRSLGVKVYPAFSCEFGFVRPKNKPDAKAQIGLTIDLQAKVIRTRSILDDIYDERLRQPKTYRPSPQQQQELNQDWQGRIAVYKIDHKCYDIVQLRFDHSANTLPVPGLLTADGSPMSHAQYFAQRKNITLRYPDARPMVEVRGKRQNKDDNIFLPAELICGNELDQAVREKLPIICSFSPDVRNRAIERVRDNLDPENATSSAQRSNAASRLLPAAGIYLNANRLKAKATIMSVPRLIAAGVPIPEGKENWAPEVSRATFRIAGNQPVAMKVVVFCNRQLVPAGVKNVYRRIRDRVNRFHALYFFPSEEPFDIVGVDTAGPEGYRRHYQDVANYLQRKSAENLFVLDFCFSQTKDDPAYPFIKQILANGGYLSQFVNFRTHRHDKDNDRRSGFIIDGVARQILQKSGVRLWWVSLPRELPLPAVFVGMDVFHAPKEFHAESGRRVAKPSCAAIVVQVVRPDSEQRHFVEFYSETIARLAGQEFGLESALERVVKTALVLLKVDPKSCIVWRDGIGEGAFDSQARDEINGIRNALEYRRQPAAIEAAAATVPSAALTSRVPLSYVVCQKEIKTKFFTKDLPGYDDGKFASPVGTTVEGIQGLKHDTFYIQGRAPPGSTRKPVRYIVVEQDESLQSLSIPELTWCLCHDFPNWTGSIKVPSVTMMAHKLAQLAGVMPNSGGLPDDRADGINHEAFVNKLHFL